MDVNKFDNPEPITKPGVYAFTWTPHTNHTYKVWADITPKATDGEEYAVAAINREKTKPDKTVNNVCRQGNLTFTLSFDSPTLKSGKPIMGKIMVKVEKGKVVTQLEPVLGAFFAYSWNQ